MFKARNLPARFVQDDHWPKVSYTEVDRRRHAGEVDLDTELEIIALDTPHIKAVVLDLNVTSSERFTWPVREAQNAWPIKGNTSLVQKSTNNTQGAGARLSH
jgi:hypothetical protein